MCHIAHKLLRDAACTGLQGGECFFTRLLKVDVVSKTSQEWKEEGTFPGEPIFVPHPEASQEDHGVLLSVVLAGASHVFALRDPDAQRARFFLL